MKDLQKRTQPNIEDPQAFHKGKERRKKRVQCFAKGGRRNYFKRKYSRKRYGIAKDIRDHMKRISATPKAFRRRMHEASINNKPEIYQKHVREYVKYYRGGV